MGNKNGPVFLEPLHKIETWHDNINGDYFFDVKVSIEKKWKKPPATTVEAIERNLENTRLEEKAYRLAKEIEIKLDAINIK